MTTKESFLTAASHCSTKSAVPISSTSEICRMASVSRSVNTLESSTSKTLKDCAIDMYAYEYRDCRLCMVAPRASRACPADCRLYCKSFLTPAHSSLNESVAQCIRSNIRVRRETHLLENPAAISAHRLNTEAQFIGDIGNAAPRSQFAKNLKFARRQTRVQGLVRVAVQIRHQNFRQGGAHVAAPRQHRAHRLHQLLP